MTSETILPGPRHRRGRVRSGGLVTAVAAAVALWLAFTAPNVSPVVPSAPPMIATPPAATGAP
jgi:hypothetical protein